ncbi:MAG: fasciclin [Burkholderiales bacterium PBB4]|nr:MAG: fasciclin [Burkholderiales bacterium PBB4]
MSIRTSFASASRRTALVAALVTLMSGCATMSGPVSVADTIAADPTLSTLNGLVQSAGLTETLKGTGPFTVFAPTNDAFKAVPAKTMEALGKDAAALKGVLTYHVIAAQVMAADVKNGKVKTVNGADLELSKAGDFVTVGENAIVTRANVAASNGVVHVIDAVVLPPAKK